MEQTNNENQPSSSNAAADVTARAGSVIGPKIDGILREQFDYLSDDQRAMVVGLAVSQGWKGDVTEKLQRAVAAFGDPVVYRGKSKPFDPGAPASSSSSQVPLDPALLPQSVIDSWTPEQARDWFDKYKKSKGAFEHPFKRARDAEAAGAAGAVAEQVSRAIAQHLSGLQGR